ncbi:hypothetical protein E0H26_23365 [Micromonospora zingiberis]|uniref:Uncharacterized protein n=1 Tax=Micromonospora zingiberis TaxID=2053011 RepID=A0A4R0G9Y3_9ACTN|nr:hypothetical protein [Micromonospora zingiberis]TCB92792.1 hypothetical protein E0H26_23365 [Micromonospora zingiberis]
MPTTLRTRVPAAFLAALLALTGCADRSGGTVPTDQNPTAATPGPDAGDTPGAGPGGQPPAGRTPLSPTDPPLIGRPTAPPSQPTELRRANVLAGRLSHGGSGPCYTLVTDDGREYALHGVDMGTFATGTWVRVTTGPATTGVDCGPGIRASILTISAVD